MIEASDNGGMGVSWKNHDNELTFSGRGAARNTLVSSAGALMVLSGIAFLAPSNIGEVAAGALIAFGVTVSSAGIARHRERGSDVTKELRRRAELDVLHARLNQMARVLEVPLSSLVEDFEVIVQTRTERLAHYAGLDESR